MLLETVGVTEGRFLGVAEVSGNGVEGLHAGNVNLGVLDDATILNVDTANFRESARCLVVVGKELGDDCELAASVDGPAAAIEVRDSHTEGVKVTAVRITETIEATLNSTVLARAASLAINGAGMRGIGCRDGISLPNVHLIAAGTEVARSSVGVTW